MSEFNSLERAVSRSLNRFPTLHRLAKSAYQRVNFHLYGDASPGTVHPAVRVRTPAEVFDTFEPAGEQFFGYFDRTPWSPDAERAVFHSPRDDDAVDLLVYAEGDLSRVATSRTWTYQQGAMTRWLDDDRIVFNDLRAGRLVARIRDVDAGEEHTVPWPIGSVHPDGDGALTLNYRRLAALRPEYGYETAATNLYEDPPLDEDGVWYVDFDDSEADLRITLDELRHRRPTAGTTDADHRVNHLLYSPSGDRFAFVHRWSGPGGRRSRLYVADAADANPAPDLLLDEGVVSHYCWRDDETLLVWAATPGGGRGERYSLLDVSTGETRPVGPSMPADHGDGHPSYSPNGRYVLTDTYPDRARLQHLFVYDTERDRRTEIAEFRSPPSYTGESRCDLHPRWSPDGRWISVDATYTGTRRSYLLDVSDIVEAG